MFKKMQLVIPLLVICFTINLITSCHHEPIIPSSPAISYKNEVEPIILGSCALTGCHGDDYEKLQLKDYDQIKRNVKPGDATHSRLYTAMIKLGPGQMPPDQPLSEEQLKLIYVWIMQGAKNN